MLGNADPSTPSWGRPKIYDLDFSWFFEHNQGHNHKRKQNTTHGFTLKFTVCHPIFEAECAPFVNLFCSGDERDGYN